MRLRVAYQKVFVGCTRGLDQRTAIVTVRSDGFVAEYVFSRIAAGVATLCTDQPLFGVDESDWPAAFLVDIPRDADDPEVRLAQWVVALTVALQRWAGDPVWRGRVLDVTEGRLRLAIPWQREGVFSDTLGLAVRLIELWAASPGDTQSVNPQIQSGMDAARVDGLSPAGLRTALAAQARGIPVEVRPGHVQYGWGANLQRFADTFSGRTSVTATVRAKNKVITARSLRAAAIPVPEASHVTDFDQALTVAGELGWPVVVKPLDQDQGLGVVTGIGDEVALHHAVAAARRLSPTGVLVERHVEGDDHRLLVVDGQVLATARRLPGGVVGDGVHTVEELIERANADPRRGGSPRSLMRRLILDAEALSLLADQDVRISSVPDSGRFVALRRTANISSGGTAEDVTALVHPDNARLAVRAARVVGLDIAGVDFITTDISRSWRDVGGAIVEVNSQPGLRPHWLGDPQRDLCGEILDSVFGSRPARIPTAAITGTNGKSTTALMLHHIWRSAGRLAGVCTTQQVRIGDQLVTDSELSGYPGARIVLTDPAVESAVIELPRKGLIVFGHPCDHYDVAALLNVQDDHFGEFGIDTFQRMAELKSEVLQRARDAVVVNADDRWCVAMLPRAGTDRHILVGAGPASVAEHRRCGGEAVFREDRDGGRWIVVAVGDVVTPVMPLHEIPATMNGLLEFNETNAAFAVALAWAQGLDTAVIRSALSSFHNSFDQNPWRYNFVAGFPFKLLVDYAHNPDGVQELCRVVTEIPVSGRRRLYCQMIGSRHPEHVDMLASVLVGTFDEIVVACDFEETHECPAYAGDDPVATMLARTVDILIAAGADRNSITSSPEPVAGLRALVGRALPGDLVVVLAEPGDAQPFITELVERGSRIATC